MSNNGSHHDDSQLILDQIADEITARLRGGEKPCADDYTSCYPDLADEIKRIFRALDALSAYVRDEPE